jgi:hypothetical protein
MREALSGRTAWPLSLASVATDPIPAQFELPVGAVVRLDVFDAQGRRVEKLASRYFPAGYHSVTWNPAGARQAGPGVYFYRMEAGPFHDRKKMVLLTN